MPNNFAHLIPSNPFYRFFPNGLVAIVNIIVPNQAELEGSEETEVYMLDVSKCTPEQIDGICTELSMLFTASAAEIKEAMHTHGMPIRSSQVNGVSTDVPFFL